MKKGVLIVFTCLACLYSISQSPRILVPYRAGNKWGYSDTLGKIIIQPKYDTVSLFDYATVHKDNHVITRVKLKGRPMVINERGTVIVPPKYDHINVNQILDEPTFFISSNGKWGVFTKGKELFPPIYDYMDPIGGVHYKVHRNSKWGVISSEGKMVIPVIYDEVRETGGNQKTGMIYLEGSNYGIGTPKVYTIKGMTDPAILTESAPPGEVLAVDVGDTENWKPVIETAKAKHGLDSIKFKGNTGIVYKGSKQGVFLGKEINGVYFFSKPYNIHHIKYFETYMRADWSKDPLAYIIVDVDGRYGMITEKEHEIIPFEYDGIEEKDGFFLLQRNGKVGFFILNTFYPVIQPAYDRYLWKLYLPVNSQWNFTLFMVEKNGQRGFVGENGIAFFRD